MVALPEPLAQLRADSQEARRRRSGRQQKQKGFSPTDRRNGQRCARVVT